MVCSPSLFLSLSLPICPPSLCMYVRVRVRVDIHTRAHAHTHTHTHAFTFVFVIFFTVLLLENCRFECCVKLSNRVFYFWGAVTTRHNKSVLFFCFFLLAALANTFFGRRQFPHTISGGMGVAHAGPGNAFFIRHCEREPSSGNQGPRIRDGDMFFDRRRFPSKNAKL